MKQRVALAIVSIAIGIGLALIPPPDGLTVESMRYIGIFVAMLLVMCFRLVDDFLAVFLACIACVFVGVADFSTVFASFAGDTVWTLIVIFPFALALSKSGLIKRIAYHVIKLFPQSYVGQVLALMVSGTVIAPLIPLGMAKVSILGPAAAAVAKASDYRPGSKGAAGLFSAFFIPSQIACFAFLTGSPMVFMLLGMMDEEVSAQFTWTTWFMACAVWLAVLLVGSFLFIVEYYSPKEGFSMPEGFIDQQLSAMGSMSRNEKVALVTLVAVFILLFFGDAVGISSIVALALGFATLYIAGVIDANDFRTKVQWQVVVMVGCILGIASLLSSTGITAWLSDMLGPIVQPVIPNVVALVIAICVVAFLLRYVIVSTTAHIAIIYAVFAPIAATLGVSPFVVLFAGWIAAFTWNLPFNNVTVIQGLPMMDDLVTWKSVLPMSYAYAAINCIALLASIPVWQLMDLA